MSNPIKAPFYFFQGLGMIFKPGLKRYSLWPLLINILVFAGLGTLAFYQFDNLLNWLLSFLPGWLDWLRFLLWPLFAISIAILFFFSFSLIGNLIAAPFNSALAAAVEARLSGKQIDAGEIGFVRDAVSSIGSELRKLTYFLLRVIPIGILFFIPVIQLAAPFIWLLFGAWMLYIEYTDYPLGNHKLAFKQQLPLLKQKRLLGLGFGFMVMFVTLIPFLNFLVIPAAVAGATKMMIENLTTE